jgi:hypothetical protein
MFIIDRLLSPLHSSSVRSTFPAFPKEHAIPKLIHQTFYQADLPEALQQNVHRLKELNPGWEYRFYNDSDIVDFIKTNYPTQVLESFERIDPRYGAARADLFRYLLLYKYGGIYLDIKSSATRPLDSVIRGDDEYLLSYWANKPGERYEGWGQHDELSHMQSGEFQQWFIAAAPGHPFLKAVIETVLQNIKRYNSALHGVGKYGVLRLTGPVPYTLSISQYLKDYNYRLIDSASDLGLSYSVYDKRAHVELFKSHYTELAFPIVKMRWIGNQTARCIYGIQYARRMLINSISGKKPSNNSTIR